MKQPLGGHLVPLQSTSKVPQTDQVQQFPDIDTHVRGNQAPLPHLPDIAQLRAKYNVSIGNGKQDEAYRNSIGLPRRRRKRKSVIDGGLNLSSDTFSIPNLVKVTQKASLSENTKDKKLGMLVCPRCKSDSFKSVKDLSRHATTCNQQQDLRRVSVLTLNFSAKTPEKRSSTVVSKDQLEKYKALEREMKELLEIQKKAEERKRMIEIQEESSMSKSPTQLNKVSSEKLSFVKETLPGLNGTHTTSLDDVTAPISPSHTSLVTESRELFLPKSTKILKSEASETLLSERDQWTESAHQGYTLAHFAVYEDNLDQLACIMEHHGDVSLADPECRTPLHYCAMYGRIGCAQRLTSEMDSADLKRCLLQSDSEGKTPLQWACESGYFNIAALLLDCDWHALKLSDVCGNTCLHSAARSGHVDLVALLLQAGGHVDGPPNHLGETPLHVASTLAVTECLVHGGADINGLDYGGRSVLFHLASRGVTDAVAFLIEIDVEGDNLMLMDNRGDTPLHAAACNGSLECVRMLLQSAVDATLLNHAGFSPSMLAVQNEFIECAELLAEYGVAIPTDEEVAKAVELVLNTCSEAKTRAAAAQQHNDRYHLSRIELDKRSASKTIADVEPKLSNEIRSGENGSCEIWYECPCPDTDNHYYWQESTGICTWVRPVCAVVVPLPEDTQQGAEAKDIITNEAELELRTVATRNEIGDTKCQSTGVLDSAPQPQEMATSSDSAKQGQEGASADEGQVGIETDKEEEEGASAEEGQECSRVDHPTTEDQ